MTSFMDSVALVPTTSVGPTTFSFAPATTQMPTSNLTITVKKEKKSTSITVVTTLVVILAIILAGLFGPKLLQKSKDLLKETPTIEHPKPDIPPDYPCWLWRSPAIRYPEAFFDRITLNQPLSNHRQSHPYFATTDPADELQHLYLTATAAANQSHQTEQLYSVRSTHTLGKVVDHVSTKPHMAQATRLLVDLLLNTYELDAFIGAGNIQTAVFVWDETKLLIRDASHILAREERKLEEQIRRARWRDAERLKRDKSEIKELKKLFQKNGDRLIHNMGRKHRTLVPVQEGGPQRYSSDVEASRTASQLSWLFMTICQHHK